MILMFKLTMPNVGSWNGKWTGTSNLYAKTLNYTKRYGSSVESKGKLKKILETKNYSYNFGDGWCANISVEAIDGKTATKVRKSSKGFMGYDWMIDSILYNNEITYSK